MCPPEHPTSILDTDIDTRTSRLNAMFGNITKSLSSKMSIVRSELTSCFVRARLKEGLRIDSRQQTSRPPEIMSRFQVEGSTEQGMSTRKVSRPLRFEPTFVGYEFYRLPGVLVQISRRKFVEKWMEFSGCSSDRERNALIFKFLLQSSAIEEDSVLDDRSLRYEISELSKAVKKRYATCSGHPERFFSKYPDWVDKPDFDLRVLVPMKPKEPGTSSGGRPRKEFSDLGVKAKRDRVSDLLARDADELVYASQLVLHASGDRLAARSLNRALDTARESSADQSKAPREYTPEEALGFFVECRMSQARYQWARISALSKGHKLYPSYKRLQEAKKLCLPFDSVVLVTERRVELPLQSLLDVTCDRLCRAEASAIKGAIDSGITEFTLYGKWGCDGSGSHSRYKQRFEDSVASDANVFMFSYVPLELRPLSDLPHVWRNPVPGSPRYCRPFKLILEKETAELTVVEVENVKSQIAALVPTKFIIDGIEISIAHRLLLTMVDVKVVNALTNTGSTQTCYICTSTSKQRANRGIPPDVIENYSFGLATLHGWIRILEFCLQLAYSMEIQKKGRLSENEKEIKESKKRAVQEQFFAKLGLILDQPKPSGGNTNDGNTARRFFENSAVSSTITGIEEKLLVRFRVILQALSSRYEIDPDKFEQYAEETAQLLADLYGWCPPTPTLHKFLDHGADIIRHLPLPPGMLTEEAQEARNKDVRRYREANTRKDSRTHTFLDLLWMLLLSSDPMVVSNCFIKPKKSRPLDPQVYNLTKTNINDAPLVFEREGACARGSSEDSESDEDAQSSFSDFEPSLLDEDS